MDYIFIFSVAVCFILYYKFVFIPDQQIKRDLKESAKFKDTYDAQDDDFCLIASAISKCKGDLHFEKCIKAVKIFQDKYGNTITGKQDVNDLINLYEKREQRIMVLS